MRAVVGLIALIAVIAIPTIAVWWASLDKEDRPNFKLAPWKYVKWVSWTVIVVAVSIFTASLVANSSSLFS